MVHVRRNNDQSWLPRTGDDRHHFTIGGTVFTVVLEHKLGTAMADEEPIPQFVVLVERPDSAPYRVLHPVYLAE